jgi:hypothetical protein
MVWERWRQKYSNDGIASASVSMLSKPRADHHDFGISVGKNSKKDAADARENVGGQWQGVRLIVAAVAAGAVQSSV